MKLMDAIRQRRSIRNFLETPITEDKLRCVLESANAAPSAGNMQAYEIFVVKEKRARLAVARAAHEQLFIASAPVSLVFCTNPARAAERYGKRGEKLYSVQDATIACAFAMLAATAHGLGSVWVGAFEPDEIRKVIGAPGGLTPIAILPLGYAAEKPDLQERRPLEDLAHIV